MHSHSGWVTASNPFVVTQPSIAVHAVVVHDNGDFLSESFYRIIPIGLARLQGHKYQDAKFELRCALMSSAANAAARARYKLASVAVVDSQSGCMYYYRIDVDYVFIL